MKTKIDDGGPRRSVNQGANMNPLIAEIEKRQSADSRVNPLLWRAQELAALKLAVEELQSLVDNDPGKPVDGDFAASGDADCHEIAKCARATLRAIAGKLGVKG